MAICENLGDHLNRIRKAKGQSITEFSEELGISRSSLQSILNGTGNPRSDTIEQIANHLKMDYHALLAKPDESITLRLTDKQQQDLLLLLERVSGSQEAAHE